MTLTPPHPTPPSTQIISPSLPVPTKVATVALLGAVVDSEASFDLTTGGIKPDGGLYEITCQSGSDIYPALVTVYKAALLLAACYMSFESKFHNYEREIKAPPLKPLFQPVLRCRSTNTETNSVR